MNEREYLVMWRYDSAPDEPLVSLVLAGASYQDAVDGFVDQRRAGAEPITVVGVSIRPKGTPGVFIREVEYVEPQARSGWVVK